MIDGKAFGRINIVPGNNKGRFPFCNSLLIIDDLQVVVDPGAGLQKLQEINNTRHIDMVLNTHVHFDHIVYNYIFNQAKIVVNELEAIFFRDRREFLKITGVVEALGEPWVDNWLERIKQPDADQAPFTPAYRHEWELSLARLDGTYRWGDILDLGHTKMEIVAAPGHSPGFSVLYFPQEGIVYCGDIDLTRYGPWCHNSDQFIASARRIADLDADFFITSHEMGVVTKAEFISKLDEYLEVIYMRDRQLLNSLHKSMSLAEITKMGLFYGPRIFEDDFLYCWEWTMVKEHLTRLVSQGMVSFEQGKYWRT